MMIQATDGAPRMEENTHLGETYRRDLKIKIAWALAAKAIALALLWLLFFRGNS
jgi:uncharacterized membrane protein